ncbi:MAG: hypothetical protein ACI9E1_001751 [Cryomorphaceae bacterium]|jgi:hypothetical protein
MKLILIVMMIMYSNICVAKVTEWHAGNLTYYHEDHLMCDVATRAIIPVESPGICIMRCMTSDISGDGSFVITGIYELVGKKNLKVAKNYVRHSIYIR